VDAFGYNEENLKFLQKIKKLHEILRGLYAVSSFSSFGNFEGSSAFIHFTCNAIQVSIFLATDVQTKFKLCFNLY